MTLGKLWNSSSIQMDYCSNTVTAFIKTGIINAKYLNLKIIEIDKLDVDTKLKGSGSITRSKITKHL